MSIATKEKQIRVTTFFILIFSLITYAVFFSSLILYITKGIKLDDIIASNITASFFAFHFTLQILGGFFCGKFFSHRSLLFISLVLQTIGCLILSKDILYWGLAFFLLGTGFNLVCINCIINHFYKPADNNREKTFLINYTAMNIGALIGTYISGLFEIHQKYNFLFLFAAISNFFTIIIVIFKWKILKDKNTYYSALKMQKKRKFLLYGILFIGFLIIALKWIVTNAYYTNQIVLFSGFLIFCYVIYLIIKNSDVVKKNLLAYLIFLLTALTFWTLYLMSPMGLILFVENNVNRNILSMKIPPQWFINITSFTIIIAGPLLVSLFKFLRKKGFHITITNQFICALLSIGIAFFILPISIKLAPKSGYVNFGFVALSYAFIGLGEILLSPIGYSMIGQIIPKKFQNIMMGIWLMMSGVATIIANIFSKMAIGKTLSTTPNITNPFFYKSFLILSSIAIIAAIILILLTKFLNKIVKDIHHNKASLFL